MCGICGVIAADGELNPAIRDAIRPMTRTLHHRGPDGEGCFADSAAALGHARLAIIDREGGAQPMPNEDRSCWVVFNGEIYNHHAMREQLIARGHRFRTTSDTEVIVHAYEEYGPRCVERLDGMFAFAVYDVRRQELLLARDRLGKKPLFWAMLDGALHFASEIKAIQASPAWDDALDLSALESYLSLGYILAPGTIYRHVRKLEPGHWLRLARRQVDIRKYWDIDEFDTHPGDARAIVDELESTLRSAVRDRLESEVPLGAFLSGGIDSGLVASFMSETLGDRLTTTTVGFSDTAHNELASAALTARAFQTRHHEAVLEPRLTEVLDPIVSAFDEPFADSSAIPTYYLSAMARRHVTVALSGDGGDEAFGGYDFRYVPHALESYVRPLVWGLGARPAVSWLGRRWPRSPRMPKTLRAGTLLENMAQDAATAYYADLCILKPPQVKRLLGRDPRRDMREDSIYESVTAPYRRCSSTSPVQRAEYADLKVYLPNDVLVKVDRMSMQHSLEVRCPLLDRRVVELAFRIPASRKFSLRESKPLLRALGRHRLPSPLLSLPKRGFSAPIGRWIARTHAAEFRADVFGAGSAVATLVDLDRVRHLFHEHSTGARDHSYALWAIWMLERWSRLRSRPQPAIASAQVVVTV
jgi:asparagine synthase (glutamine-hydrolysing)